MQWTHELMIKGKKVLFKWDSEVYEILNVRSDDKIVVKNIKSGTETVQPKEEFIYIFNM